MPEVTLYIAISLDGYIADSNGDVDWLSKVEIADEDYGYHDFYQSVDALVMGNKTYRQILQFGDWPYTEKPCWIYTHDIKQPAEPLIHFTSETPTSLLLQMEQNNYQHIWLVGGADIMHQFQSENLITRYIISIIPIILGNGISLFSHEASQHSLTLLSSKHYQSGLVQLHYRHDNSD